MGRVARLAVHLANRLGHTLGNVRKRLRAVGGKVAVGGPRLAVVDRLLDEHGRWPKRA